MQIIIIPTWIRKDLEQVQNPNVNLRILATLVATELNVQERGYIEIFAMGLNTFGLRMIRAVERPSESMAAAMKSIPVEAMSRETRLVALHQIVAEMYHVLAQHNDMIARNDLRGLTPIIQKELQLRNYMLYIQGHRTIVPSKWELFKTKVHDKTIKKTVKKFEAAEERLHLAIDDFHAWFKMLGKPKPADPAYVVPVVEILQLPPVEQSREDLYQAPNPPRDDLLPKYKLKISTEGCGIKFEFI